VIQSYFDCLRVHYSPFILLFGYFQHLSYVNIKRHTSISSFFPDYFRKMKFFIEKEKLPFMISMSVCKKLCEDPL